MYTSLNSFEPPPSCIRIVYKTHTAGEDLWGGVKWQNLKISRTECLWIGN